MVSQAVQTEPRTIDEKLPRVKGKRTLLRDSLVFLAGAQAFHTVSHIWLGLSGMLPMEIQNPPITVTAGMNLFAIGVNALITVGLLYGARRARK